MYGNQVRFQNLATDYRQFFYPMPSIEIDFWAIYLSNTHENLIQYTFDSKESKNHHENSPNVIFHENFKVLTYDTNFETFYWKETPKQTYSG